MSHNLAMEKITSNTASTNEKITITSMEAEEYAAFKRAKKTEEIMRAFEGAGALLNTLAETPKSCLRAERLKLSSLRVAPSLLPSARGCLKGKSVALDCIVGGTGEALTKTKLFETRLALRKGAKRITLVLNPSYLHDCRYGELKKEIKRVRRAVGKGILSVYAPLEIAYTAKAKAARLASEAGANFFTTPWFSGCERLRFDTCGRCKTEISGKMDLAEMRKLLSLGIRVVPENVWELYVEWTQEVGKISFLSQDTPLQESKTGKTVETLQKTALLPLPAKGENKNQETEYCCRLENGKLKFL